MDDIARRLVRSHQQELLEAAARHRLAAAAPGARRPRPRGEGASALRREVAWGLIALGAWLAGSVESPAAGR